MTDGPLNPIAGQQKQKKKKTKWKKIKDVAIKLLTDSLYFDVVLSFRGISQSCLQLWQWLQTARIIHHIGGWMPSFQQFSIIDLVFLGRPRHQSIAGTRTTVATAKRLCTHQKSERGSRRIRVRVARTK